MSWERRESSTTKLPHNRLMPLSKGDIDFEYMRNEAGQRAGKRYDAFWKIVDGRAIPRWNDILKKHGRKHIDVARDEYHDNEVVKDLNESEEFGGSYFFFNNMEEFEESRGDYIENARRSTIVTFAVLYNGQWYEKGEMGWWAMVSNEKDADEWNDQFYKLLDGLPDDTLLSIYDLHI